MFAERVTATNLSTGKSSAFMQCMQRLPELCTRAHSLTERA